jgi:hypothetical protein
MPRSRSRRKRLRGGIEELPSGALRVSVYAGRDPISGRRLDLRETIPPGPNAQAEAEKAAARRFAAEIDERRHPTTNAALDVLLDRYLETLDVAESTRKMYRKYCTKHVRPSVGRLKAGAADVETLDSLYAELRRCRIHCDRSRGLVDHRTPREHECDRALPSPPVQGAGVDDNPAHPLRPERRLREGCALALGEPEPGTARGCTP